MQYLATRINPTLIHLTCNDVDVTKSSIPKTNEKIINIIGITSDVFSNSIIMSANDTTPFMSQSKTLKRKFIEGILNIDVFSRMLLMARQSYNDLKKDADILNAKLEENNNTLVVYNNEKQERDKYNKKKTIELTKRFNDNKREIKKLQKLSDVNYKEMIDAVKSDLKILLDTESQLSEKHQIIFQSIITLQESNKNIGKKIKRFNKIGNICNACNRPMANGDTEKLNNTISDLESKQSDINKSIDKYNKNLKRINTKKLKIKNDITKLRQLKNNHINDMVIAENNQSHIKNMIESNNQIDIDIKELSSKCESFIKNINELKDRIAELTSKSTDIKIQLKNLDIIKYIVSEEGVKSYIIKKILKILNDTLNKYLVKLNAPCSCNFNEYFDECIINKNGQQCSYYNFSGGERKRIDLAILFTFMDIQKYQGNSTFNVTVYDEILDGSLDKNGIELFVNILKERLDEYGGVVYIITHHPEALDMIQNVGAKMIYLKKVNGFTYKDETEN